METTSENNDQQEVEMSDEVVDKITLSDILEALRILFISSFLALMITVCIIMFFALCEFWFMDYFNVGGF